jgi:hypothetical protein
MRRPRREMGQFILSVSFAAGFIIRDLMEEESTVRKAVKNAWSGLLDFLTPADDKKTHFPDKKNREELVKPEADDSKTDDSEELEDSKEFDKPENLED